MNYEYRHTVLVLCMLAFFVTYVARMAISPVIPFIISDFGISNSLIGIALTGMWLAYGLAQFPSGILADRYGEKPIILLAVGGTTVMSILLSMTPLFPVFTVFAVGLGGMAGLHYAVGTTLLTRTFDDLGTAIGVHSVGGPLAGLIAPVAAAWVAVRFGWRPAIAVTAIAGAPIFVLVLGLIRPMEPRKPDTAMRETIDVNSIVELISRPKIAFPLLIAMAGTYVVQGLLSFFPAFLIAFQGFSPTRAALAFSGFFVVRAGSQIGLGRVSDSYSRDLAIGSSMLLGAVGLTLLLVNAGIQTLVLGVIMTGIGSGFFSAIDPRFMDALTPRERGTGFGLVRTVYTVIGAAGSAGVGITIDLFGWTAAISSLAFLFIISFMSLVVNHAFKFGY